MSDKARVIDELRSVRARIVEFMDFNADESTGGFPEELREYYYDKIEALADQEVNKVLDELMNSATTIAEWSGTDSLSPKGYAQVIRTSIIEKHRRAEPNYKED